MLGIGTRAGVAKLGVCAVKLYAFFCGVAAIDFSDFEINKYKRRKGPTLRSNWLVPTERGGSSINCFIVIS
jgi:hypothetical protein